MHARSRKGQSHLVGSTVNCTPLYEPALAISEASCTMRVVLTLIKQLLDVIQGISLHVDRV